MKLYDKVNKRLVMFEKSASRQFWDEHWQSDNLSEAIKSGENNRFVKKFTTKFLNPSSKVLEGGCGIGQNVYGLQKWGYDAFGVDFAEQTINKTKQCFPDMKISVQDVKRLNFPDSFFDGCWSLGVIEHFFDGYDEILKEAYRVIKPGGYLFLTFPYMSPLRKFKAKLGMYGNLKPETRKDNFYQFIFDVKQIKESARTHGFQFVLQQPFDAVKGLKDEISLLRPVLHKLYNSKNIVAKGVRRSISILFSWLFGHVILLILQKNEN